MDSQYVPHPRRTTWSGLEVYYALHWCELIEANTGNQIWSGCYHLASTDPGPRRGERVGTNARWRLVSDELLNNRILKFGTFFNPNDREMVDVLVSLWDGQIGTWEKRTKTQGADLIVNPWINIAACTTPGWIAGSFPEYLIGGGFTSRCVFVYAKRKRRLVAYPGRIIPDEFKELQSYLVHDLEQISTVRGPYTMTDEAVAYGEKWYQEHNDTRPKHLDNERFGGYLAKEANSYP